MEVFIVSFSAILLTGLIHASLGLDLGCLLLLSRYSLGSKTRRPNTKSFTSSFIAGAGTITLLLIMSLCFLLINLTGDVLPVCLTVIEICVLFTLGLTVWWFYYKKGPGTILWIPRPIARFLDNRLAKVENNTDAFSLGLIASLGEAPLNLVLIFFAASTALQLPIEWQLLAVTGYTIITILPLVIFKCFIKSGKNLVRIQKWRESNKFFLKTITSLGFFILAAFIFVFEILPLVGHF